METTSGKIRAQYNETADKIQELLTRVRPFTEAHDGEEGTTLLIETMNLLGLTAVLLKVACITCTLMDSKVDPTARIIAATELMELTRQVNEEYKRVQAENDSTPLDPDEATRAAEAFLRSVGGDA